MAWFLNSGGFLKKQEVDGLFPDAYRRYADEGALLAAPVKKRERKGKWDDAVLLEQLKTIHKDVMQGRTDAGSFTLGVGDFMARKQRSQFGADYVDKAREQLARVLRAYVVRNRVPGYVQGMNNVVALLLCAMEEEPAFWTFCAMAEDLRATDYYASPLTSMNGFQIECDALTELAWEQIPQLRKVADINELGLTVQLLASKLLLPLFVNQVPLAALSFIWNSFFSSDAEFGLIRVFMTLLGELSEELTLTLTDKAKLDKDINESLAIYKKVLDLTAEVSSFTLQEEMLDQALSPLQVRELFDKARAVRAKDWLGEGKTSRFKQLPELLNMEVQEVQLLLTWFQSHMSRHLATQSERVTQPVKEDPWWDVCLPKAWFDDMVARLCDRANSFCYMPSQYGRLARLFVGQDDGNRQGRVAFHEVARMASVFLKGNTEHRLWLCFQVHDTNDLGFLDETQLGQVAAGILNTLSRFAPILTAPSSQASSTSAISPSSSPHESNSRPTSAPGTPLSDDSVISEDSLRGLGKSPARINRAGSLLARRVSSFTQAKRTQAKQLQQKQRVASVLQAVRAMRETDGFVSFASFREGVLCTPSLRHAFEHPCQELDLLVQDRVRLPDRPPLLELHQWLQADHDQGCVVA